MNNLFGKEFHGRLNEDGTYHITTSILIAKEGMVFGRIKAEDTEEATIDIPRVKVNFEILPDTDGNKTLYSIARSVLDNPLKKVTTSSLPIKHGCTSVSENITNEYAIRNLWSKEQIAKALISSYDEDEWDYNSDDEPYVCGSCTYYEASDGETYTDYSEAFEHEIWWMSQKYDNGGGGSR